MSGQVSFVAGLQDIRHQARHRSTLAENAYNDSGSDVVHIPVPMRPVHPGNQAFLQSAYPTPHSQRFRAVFAISPDQPGQAG